MPTSKSKSKPLLLYTLGDPASIGPEILVKALSKKKLLVSATHVLIGDINVLSKAKKNLFSSLNFHSVPKFDFVKLKEGMLNVIDLQNAREVSFGYPSSKTGKASLEYLETALEIIKEYPGVFKALITLPVSKKYIQMNGIRFLGHTEYLRDKFKAQDVLMIFLTPDFDLLVYTRHIPLKEVVRDIKSEELIRAIIKANEFYCSNLGITPKIALLGINPHAGEAGFIGEEEKKLIVPAIKKLQQRGLKVEGPYPADGFFRNLDRNDYNLVVSMYHDQTLPLVKALYKDVVNFTLGLPFFRFSTCHGTAFDIAGKCMADSASLEKAMEYALRFRWR